MYITSLFSHNFLVSTLLTWKFVGLSAWNYCQILSSNCFRIWQVRCHSDVLLSLCLIACCLILRTVWLPWLQYRLSGLYTTLCDIGAGLIYKEQCLGVNWNQGGSVFFGDCRMTFWWVSHRHTMLIMIMIRVFVFCCSMNDEDMFWCRQNMVSCRLWLRDNVWKWYCLYSI